MPLFILLVGIVLVAAGINDKIPTLIALLKDDFKPTDGNTPFQIWMLAIIAIGAIGYIKPLKGFANGFLALIIIVIILGDQKAHGSSNGFFANLTKALKG